MEEISVDLEAQSKTVSCVRNAPTIFEKSDHPAVTLTFEDVKYEVITSKSEGKEILKGVTGIVQPGEMLAILGPSGSGKTTLLSALGGRLGGNLSGTIKQNGLPFSNKSKRNTGFVTQDDIMYPHLTVHETLVFTALLRLPNIFTEKDKIAQAETVISQLGLINCKDSIVGGPSLRGVSGGERKRVSIGQELLINPSLLLLDEPTSGLDSTTAKRIVTTLRDIGTTVVMTIHQPSTSIFHMFHKVLLLSQGDVMYFGKGDNAIMDYFASIGFTPSYAMNPSDFLLDLANGISSDGSTEDQTTVKQTILTAFKANISGQLKMDVQETGIRHYEGQDEKQIAEWSTTWFQQFIILFQRGLKEQKHEAFAALNVIQVVLVSFLCGLLWWNSNRNHLQDQIGLFFFYTAFWGFYSLNEAIFAFPPERVILEKERASGMYRLSSYFMARTMTDLPMQLVLPTVFVLITYWMAGLRASPSTFFETLSILLYSVLVTQSLGLAIGALVMQQKAAATLGAVIMLSYHLTGGFIIREVPAFVAWMKYISATQHTYKLFLIAHYNPMDTYKCGDNTCLIKDFASIQFVGLHGKWVCVMAMAIMLLGFRLAAYLALTKIGATIKIK